MKKIIFKIPILAFLIIIGGLSLISSPKAAIAADCTVTSATFNHDNNYDKNFFTPTNKPQVTVSVQSQHCENKVLFLTIMMHHTAFLDENTAVFNQQILTPDTNQFQVVLQTGDQLCTDVFHPNCTFYIAIGPEKITTFMGDHYYHSSYLSLGKTNGELNYDCSVACVISPAAWSYISDTGAKEVTDPVLGVTIPFVTQRDDPKTNNTPNAVTLDNGPSTVDVNSACYDKAKGAMIPGCYSIYSGLADILNKTGSKLSVITDATSLGDFLNGIFAVIIGLAGVAAVVMIMYHGFTYMKSDNVSFKTETRGKIVKTVLGLLLLLTMYTILRTINPDLLTLVPNFDSAALSGGVQLTPQQFEQVTGEKLGTPSQYDAMAKDIAAKYNSDYCALRVIVQNETRGNAALVGQDENAPVDISSRKAFVKSGQKFSGATFSPTDALITDHKFCNDATKSCIGNAPNPDSPTLGLDWRFSKGIGLTQITFYPDGYKTNYTANPANKGIAPTRTFNFPDGAMTVSPKDVFKPEKNLEISAKLWNAGMAKCNDPKGAFNTYMCGDCSCSGAYATKEVSERTSQYNQCKAENQKPA